jgi:hypothetical protein
VKDERALRELAPVLLPLLLEDRLSDLRQVHQAAFLIFRRPVVEVHSVGLQINL